MAYTTIDDPTKHFNTVIWTGDIQDSDGTGHDQAVTGVGFQPDWIWHKCRSHANQHIIVDSVRGTGGSPTQMLGLNSAATAGNVNSNTNGWIESIDSDGYTVTSGSDSSGKSNNAGANGRTYVAWNWLAGGSASSNSDGSITSSVSANQTAGFSILTFTGTQSVGTVGHGLGSKPAWILLKNTADSSDAWYNYHEGLASDPETDYIILNTDAAKVDYNTPWNDTAPTSSVFTVGADGGTNESGSTMVAYCFAEKKGFSKFGQYSGNGSTDGTFVYTGFKPAFLIMKASSATGNWFIFDSKRDGFNHQNDYLKANSSDAEVANERVDLLSNGFKFRTSNSGWNGSGATYIYMAFAESPFVNSNGIPNNAR